jgi:transmembrane sensor
MTSEQMYDLIGKYLAGELSEEEKEKFQVWLNESEGNKQEFELHKKVWKNTQIKFKSSDSESVFKNLLNQIDDQHELEISTDLPTYRTKVKYRFLLISKIAASLLLLVSVWYFFNNATPVSKDQISEIKTNEKHNPAGQKSRIFLPDGSTVWLNADSKVSYPEKFTDEKREVILNGEAFFEIVKNQDIPFIVRTGKVSTIVLGTAFNVKAFDDDPVTQVALQSGKVKVEFNDNEQTYVMFLDPGDALTYNKSESSAKKNKFEEERLLSWKDGFIVFRDADLDEIVSTLSRWYGVQFEIKNRDNESWSYTGSFDNAILENVMKSISFTKEFSYTINQKNVIIEFN